VFIQPMATPDSTLLTFIYEPVMHSHSLLDKFLLNLRCIYTACWTSPCFTSVGPVVSVYSFAKLMCAVHLFEMHVQIFLILQFSP
jgi:hypothetical protein